MRALFERSSEIVCSKCIPVSGLSPKPWAKLALITMLRQ